MSSVNSTPGGNKTFKSDATKLQAAGKQDNIRENLKDNIIRSENAKPPDKSKIDQIKNAGKAFIDRYFRGFTSEKRANITADIDDFIVYRIEKEYHCAIFNFAEYKTFVNAKNYATQLDLRLFGAISLALAIKLQASSTEIEKKTNRVLSCLDSSIILPKKCAVLLDQIGKTDIPGDNHLRIRNQNFAAKRHLVRGIYNIIPKDEIVKYFTLNNYEDKWTDLHTVMESHQFFSKMIDDSPWSVSRLKQIGKQIYEERTQENFSFWDESDSETIFTLRLPKVDFEKLDLKTIGTIISNDLFSNFKFDSEKMRLMASGLILGVAKTKWLQDPKKKMEELETVLQGTWFEGQTFKQILDYCGIWNLGFYFDDIALNTLGTIAIQRWNTALSKPFNEFLNMGNIVFSEHGSDAQLVKVDKSNLSNKEGLFGYVTEHFESRNNATSVIKPTENGAILGTMIGYTDNIEYKADWNVEFNSTNKLILYEFLKNDLKDSF